MVVNVAEPLIKVPLPRLVAPSLNETVPVGVPAPGALAETVAVKVTDWPKTDGLADDVTTVVVASLFTVCVNDGEALPVKLPSPRYDALMAVVPTGSELIGGLIAVPPANATGAPRLAAPAKNCTLPVGLPAPGGIAFTVAVNVTAWPNTEGLVEDAVTTVEVSALPTVRLSVPVEPLKFVPPE